MLASERRTDEYIACCDQNLQWAPNKIGPESMSACIALVDLGDGYNFIGDLMSASKLYTEALEIVRKKRGEDNDMHTQILEVVLTPSHSRTDDCFTLAFVNHSSWAVASAIKLFAHRLMPGTAQFVHLQRHHFGDHQSYGTAQMLSKYFGRFVYRNLPQQLQKTRFLHGGLPVGYDRRSKLENCKGRLSTFGRPPFKFQQLLGRFPLMNSRSTRIRYQAIQ